MLGSPCSPCCTQVVPCISNQDNFQIRIEIAAFDYFQQLTEIWERSNPDREFIRKTSTFFQGSLLNGTFITSSSQGFCTNNRIASTCNDSDGVTYDLGGDSGDCCAGDGLSLTIFNDTDPTNYELRFGTPFVRIYKEIILLPTNTDDCDLPEYKNEDYFLEGGCCTNRFLETPPCSTIFEDKLINQLFFGTCSNGLLTASLPHTVTAELPFVPDDLFGLEGYSLTSSTVDTQYGSLDVTINSITFSPT